MDTETATVYATALDSLGIIIDALDEWADMLKDSERDEAHFHIHTIAEAINRFTLAIADFEGSELWKIQSPDTKGDRLFTLPVMTNQE